jgi:RNA polymerase sigma-70 factor, ECF subfamily
VRPAKRGTAIASTRQEMVEKRGDGVSGSITKQSFARAAREHESLLTSIARRLCGNDADAEDLVHDTYERALRSWNSDLGETHLRSWIVAILNHLFIDRCRRARRAPRTEAINGREIAAIEQTAPAAWSSVSDDQIGAALATLDIELRRVYELRAGGRSYEQIAAELRIPEATVGTRLFRARKRLRAALARTDHPGVER